MITGYNTDVKRGSVVFHVQTEDKGVGNPCIESLIYVGGQVLARRRAGYRTLMDDGGDKKAIVELMERQHRLMIAEIQTGKLDSRVEALRSGAPMPPAEETTVAEPEPSDTAGPLPEAPSATLDQVILDYLNSEAEQEQLVLTLEVEGDLALARTVRLVLHTKSSLTGRPIGGARVAVKMISTVTEPVSLASGRTDDGGDLRLQVQLPNLQRGSAALIVTATSDVGGAEIKQLI